MAIKKMRPGNIARIFAGVGWVSALCLPQTAYAAPACSGNTCTGVRITQFIPMDDGTVYLATDATSLIASSINCTMVSGVQVTLAPTANDRLFSYLMTSYFQASPVSLRFYDSSSGCKIYYAF